MPIAFIAGATGYTGKILLEELASNASWKARPHARSAGKLSDPDAVVCDPWDRDALAAGMRGCDAVVQLIGTTRKQFADGGTYEKVDYGTTVALGEAALAAGVPRFLLLSSVGAGKPRGHYLKVKRQTEEWVEKSGLEHAGAAFADRRRRSHGWSNHGRVLEVFPVAPRDRRARSGEAVRARAGGARAGEESDFGGEERSGSC